MKKIIVLIVMLCSLALTAQAGLRLELHRTNTRTLLGIERLHEPEVAALLQGKRVGVFTNQSGVDSSLRGSVDLLRAAFNVTAILVPEHGLFGAVPAGENFTDTSYEGIKVFCTYNGSHRPSREMLELLDVVAVDIQDVGTRHYTYTSSLAYLMEECAKYGKEVIVFDRPNPLGGAMQGPVLKPAYKSFIGLYEVPLRHGLTLGEFARYINHEEKINCHLHVVPMKKWQRRMLWQDTGLPWVQTSPLIPTAETALLYGATGITGDTALSVGVGTAKPFYFVGAPFADSGRVTEALRNLKLPGVFFRRAAFTPRYGAYKDELVQGAEIYLADPRHVNLPELDFLIVHTLRALYPEDMGNLPKRYDGSMNKVDIALGEDSMSRNEEPQRLFPRWREECAAFSEKVKPYLLYK